MKLKLDLDVKISFDPVVMKLLTQLVATAHRIEEKVMALNPEIQSAISEIAETKDLVASVQAAQVVSQTMISGLTQQVADLQAQLASGTPVAPEDLAELATSVADLDQANKDIAAATTANT